MREDTLRRFFLGETPATVLSDEVLRSITRVDEVTSEIAVKDMPDEFNLTRQHLIALCDATFTTELEAEALIAIAFALLATDRFVWEDDVMSEVLFDWSCPEVNFPIVPRTLEMHRRWLAGEETVPVKPPLPADQSNCRLVYVRRKAAADC
jgi:hypothetical protein